jgi:molecular chaperone IbpA
MRQYDLTPLYRSTVGFDRLFNLLDGAGKPAADGGYPPYNIERLDEDAYQVTMAVAGFSVDELTVEVRDNTLHVSGQKGETEADRRFLHRGIATRSFERRFELADHVKISAASLENGLLSIDLRREIPEEKKPRRIAIDSPEARAA